MIKESIHRQDIKTTKIYAPTIGTLEYTKEILTELKKEIKSNTIIVGDFTTPTFSTGQIIQTENKGTVGITL